MPERASSPHSDPITLLRAGKFGEAEAVIENLVEQLEAAHERLSQYEEPGYITAVQKVIELKEQFDACDAERKRLQDQVDALDAMLGRHHEIGTLSDRVLSQNCPVCYPASTPKEDA